MKLYSIDTGGFKLDGGAMFGVVPKKIWNKLNPADRNNLCSWAMRCLLIEDEKRLILVDTGMGDKQDKKWFAHYAPFGKATLLSSIKALGFSEQEITDVILTHLHFDHVGGAVCWNNTKDNFKPTFPNANYWVHSEQYYHAVDQPNSREKASFLSDNIQPLKKSERLLFTDKQKFDHPAIEFISTTGHTERMLMVKINHPNQTILFTADTIPSSAHIHIPYVMGYDIRPLQTMKEKESLLQSAVNNKWILMFDHDPVHECASVRKTEKGFKLDETASLKDFLS